LFAQSTGLDWLAFGAGDRALPASLARTDFTLALPAAEVNGLVGELRNVWSARERSAAPNASASATLGGNLPVGANGVSYLVSGTYSSAQEVRTDQVRALATTQSSGEAEEVDRFTGSTGRTTVLWGGIANASTTIGTHSKVSFNNTYNRTMDNEGRRESGYSENLGLPLDIQRLRYVERNVLSTQLSLHHELGGRHMIDWGLSRSSVGRREPDRSEIVYARESEGSAPAWYGFSNEAAVRTFADLSERSLEANASWQYYLGEPSDNRSIKLGGQYRSTDRVADNNAYSISLARPLSLEDRQRAPEELFGDAFTGGGDDYFRIVPLAAGGSYTAKDRLAAAFAMVTWPLLPTVDITGGARIERSTVRVSSLSTVGTPSLAEPAYTDVLPSLALTWRAGADVNLRFSVSQTLSRPEYRELSPILYREVIGFDNVRGNPDLRRALIQNYDIRWEWYPNRGEIISLGVFAKEFTDPIERIYLGSSGTRIISYVNARGASNRGVEVELRKQLGAVSDLLRNVALFTNATVMKSTISIDPDAGSITNASRRMVGQAPYVVNAGLTWTHPSANASATVLFNRVGARITEAGELPLPDVIEQARSVLDVSLRFPIAGALDGRVDARNLLDTPYLTTQGDVTRERYRAGRVFAVGFSWKP
jgi:TonB-dependent receptor